MKKWEYKTKSKNGNDSVVHYVKDPKTGNLFNFINASSSLRRSPNIAKPSPPNQIINKHSSITREEVERLKEQVAEFKEAYGQDFDEQIKNLAVEYEQTADGNTEAYFTLLICLEYF
jgi:hypothetical protein